MSKKTKIEVEPHWLHSLAKVRCWLEGYHAGRSAPGTLPDRIPGEDVLRQIQVAITGATVHDYMVDKKSKK
jgi:hypothetical protein